MAAIYDISTRQRIDWPFIDPPEAIARKWQPNPGFMQPENDLCIGCFEVVNKFGPHYLVWDWDNSEWRRECLECHRRSFRF